MGRLLVLWVLSERASYGYEIKKALSDDGMAFWFGLDDTSIYSALRTLVKHGCARVVGVEQQGARPQRTRYEITAEGRRHYRELLAEALATPRPPTAPIDVALASSGDLDAATVRDALSRRDAALAVLEHGILAAAKASPSRSIVERHLATVRAERAWLADLDPSTIT